MKVYHGTVTEHGCAVVVEEDGQCRSLDPRFDLRTHSSTGFSWGSYGSSGPAQLSLALAAEDIGDDDKARGVYQCLKCKLVGGLPPEGWTLTEGHVKAAIEAIEQQRDRLR